MPFISRVDPCMCFFVSLIEVLYCLYNVDFCIFYVAGLFAFGRVFSGCICQSLDKMFFTVLWWP